MNLHFGEILLIVFVIVLLFGAGKLPQLGGALGKSIREFRRGKAGELDEEEKGKSKTSEEKKE